MSKKVITRVTLLILLQEVLQCATAQLGLQAQLAPHPAVAPLNRYFIPAKAPESNWPAVLLLHPFLTERRLVLTQDGYVTAVKGRNGFVCLVERSWAKTTDDPEFWSPKVRAPICANAAAARTYAASHHYRE
jgi:hypothetical protein